MRFVPTQLLSFSRSLYARLVLIYLASLLLLSLSAAWLAASQFGQLTQEMQQRMQLDLAQNLAQVLEPQLTAGVHQPQVAQAVQQIMAINPTVSLYLLDAEGHVIRSFNHSSCAKQARIDPQQLDALRHNNTMLPAFVSAPCSHQDSIFSVAPLHYGSAQKPGYLLALLGGEKRMSMLAMLRTSSITHTLILVGSLALLVTGVLGLLLFALLTRRFSQLNQAVESFAQGDYQQRIKVTHDDEIGRLSSAFNNMAATIEVQLQALRENDRQRRELVAGLSHDFRTPLTSLSGYVKLLQADQPADADALRAILANSERLSQLASQLSTLARVDALEDELHLETFSLAELAQDIIGKFQPQAQAAGVSLKVDAQPGIQVRADLALIDRALANLVDNALRATDPGGSVQLSVQAEEGSARISVSDTGIGLASDDIPLITQRFYRTQLGRERGDGSGLGLAIVAEVCARHDTRLVIHSQADQGTSMSFRLGLAAT